MKRIVHPYPNPSPARPLACAAGAAELHRAAADAHVAAAAHLDRRLRAAALRATRACILFEDDCVPAWHPASGLPTMNDVYAMALDEYPPDYWQISEEHVQFTTWDHASLKFAHYGAAREHAVAAMLLSDPEWNDAEGGRRFGITLTPKHFGRPRDYEEDENVNG